MLQSITILCPDSDSELNWSCAYLKISEALSTVGIATHAVPWSSPMSHKSDAVSPLLAWGYQRKIGRWNKLLDVLSEEFVMINAPELLRWSSTKHYLFDLRNAGIPVIPTIYRSLARRSDLHAVFNEFNTDTLIIKPVVGAGSEGLIRVNSPDDAPSTMTEVLFQPFVKSICEHGELSLVYFSGDFSHAVCKMPRAGDIRVQAHFGATSFAIEPPEACLVLGNRVVGACPGLPTYARVDMLRDDSSLYVMEVELIEPELYLLDAPGNLAPFADAFAKAMP